MGIKNKRKTPLDGRYVPLGEILRAERLKNGITQYDLANQLKFQQAFASKLERGSRPMTVMQLFDICEELHISPAKVIRDLRKLLQSDVCENLSEKLRTKTAKKALISEIRRYLGRE